ncbi:transglutaminase-like cysteine peptidase [Glaciecola petra]|uniref:Transglutaminase-like cysteine peptidase n=1 Tax=Glaciecola petra TaxID=3075602 RepID=A0ABU2ZTI9_9ALTE|nr:transglutaminase-like cysteine peptidase [Aestuariibacter sp. P117]MDT0595953.1 transglutaminase-like cysteine peptidase [Aestuariibacter sp. P117]
MALNFSHKIMFALMLTCLFVSVFSNIEFSEQVFANMREKYDAQAEQRARDWQRLILANQNVPIEDKLYEANKFFNRMSFEDDIKHWGKVDYWATPLEFLGKDAGDCEDFTIAKYFTLLEMGVENTKLKLMYVTATRPRQAHMVLAYYETPSSIPLVLDNLNKRILLASQRRDLIPIYSFNGEGLWEAKEQGRGRQLQKGGNNKLWADVNSRMQQGF